MRNCIAGVDKKRTFRARLQNMTYCLSVSVDVVTPRHKISAVTLHEHGIFRPVQIFIFLLPSVFELGIVWSGRVEYGSVYPVESASPRGCNII